jgi:hypothetical protein
MNRVIERGRSTPRFGQAGPRGHPGVHGVVVGDDALGKQGDGRGGARPGQHADAARFMRAQHELLGKYEGFRRGCADDQGVAPFLPWALNAARFVYWTMPAHHSALTSVLVKTNEAVKKDWDADPLRRAARGR